MSDKELTEDELEEELDKAFKANEAKKDHCGLLYQAIKKLGYRGQMSN